MRRKKVSQSITVRPTIKVFESLNPELFQALASLGEDIRGEFVLQVLKDWSRGLVTPHPAYSVPSGGVPAKSRSNTPDNINNVSSSAGLLHEKDLPSSRLTSSPSPSSNVATQSTRDSEIKAAERPALVATDADSPRGLEHLGFKSLADLGDAFDYSKPHS